MSDTTKTRLTADQKIAALEQEIADRRAKAEAKASVLAGLKKFQLEQAEAKASAYDTLASELEGWFASNGIDPNTVTAVAPVKPAAKDTQATA